MQVASGDWRTSVGGAMRGAARKTGPIIGAWRFLRKAHHYCQAGELWQRSKPNRTERTYLRLREDYYHQLPHLFSPGETENTAYRLLRRQWARPRQVKHSMGDVRIFAVDWPQLAGPTILPMLARDFDSVLFNVCSHQEQYLLPGSQADRIDPADPDPHVFHRGRGLEAWRNQLQNDLLRSVASAHSERPIDLVFIYGLPSDFYPDTLGRIRSLGIPIAFYWLDEKHSFSPEQALPSDRLATGPKVLIGSCDVHLTNTREALRWYMAHGVAAYYFPEGVDTLRYSPRALERDIPVSFVGSNFGKRAGFLRQLLDLGLPIQCYGRGWPNGPVKDDVEIYCRSQINLGIGLDGDSTRLTCIKGRDLEIPGTGSFYLTTYDAELAHLFDVGREIACYRNEFDCAEVIRYYLERPEETDAIGEAARHRCLQEHTWTHRFAGLLRWMGILDDQQEGAPLVGVLDRGMRRD